MKGGSSRKNNQKSGVEEDVQYAHTAPSANWNAGGQGGGKGDNEGKSFKPHPGEGRKLGGINKRDKTKLSYWQRKQGTIR